MALFTFWQILNFMSRCNTEPENCQITNISVTKSQIKNIRSLYFLQLLKLEKIKCRSFFYWCNIYVVMDDFFICHAVTQSRKIDKLQISLLKKSLTEKSKTSLFSSTFKVIENKMVLIFLLTQHFLSYGLLVYLRYGVTCIEWKTSHGIGYF